jgi:hypothetical protein
MLSASGRHRIPISSSKSPSRRVILLSKSKKLQSDHFLELLYTLSGAPPVCIHLLSGRTPPLFEIRTEDIAWKSDGRRPEEVLSDLLGHQFPNPLTNPDQVWTLDLILSLFLDTAASAQRLAAHTFI